MHTVTLTTDQARHVFEALTDAKNAATRDGAVWQSHALNASARNAIEPATRDDDRAADRRTLDRVAEILRTPEWGAWTAEAIETAVANVRDTGALNRYTADGDERTADTDPGAVIVDGQDHVAF